MNKKQEADDVFKRKHFRLDLKQALMDARKLTAEAGRLPLSVGYQDRARQAWKHVKELCTGNPILYSRELVKCEEEIKRLDDAAKLAEETLQ